VTIHGAPTQRISDVPVEPTHRPTSTKPSELGFTPAKPVHWLSPAMLANTAARVVISNIFGELLDKRELEGALPTRIHDERPDQTDDTELWFDFVADLGDGFDPTYSIAYLLAQDELQAGGETLPRGRFLMMGGDEIYPTPSKTRYDDKTKGPYKAAMPIPPAGALRPAIYALPGNHDWYDGLSSFLRLFVKDDKDNIGGWRNAQARSYFAIRLPQRWWILAVDTQFGAYIDDAQLDYFRTVMTLIGREDKVIMCGPNPSWVEAVNDPSAYDALDYFMRTVLLPTGAQVKVMLSGDLHHYARYQGNGRHLIHCGGGGAYLYPTHRMPEAIQVPPPEAPYHKQSEPTARYDLKHTYPSKAQSRRYAAGVFFRAPIHNAGFIAMLGALQTVFMYSLLGLFTHVSRVTSHWLELPVGLLGAVMMGGTIAFAHSSTGGGGRRGWRFVLGILHGVIQIGLGVLGTWQWAKVGFIDSPWPAPAFASLIYFVVSGVVATLIFCLYLLVASARGVNVNELFASQSIVDSKSFLRLHIDATGALTIYPIKVPKVSRKWVAAPAGDATDPWIKPAAGIGHDLAEPKIVVR
jgi:hypothetical protein